MGAGEIILIVALALILLSKAFLNPPAQPAAPTSREFLLWIAQGFGVGRIPFAPGTFGSVVGVVWFGLLVASRKLWVLIGGTLAGLALSVWLCDVAEKMIGRKDPGSVVLDEIAAVPLCFFSWVGIVLWQTGSEPGVEGFFSGEKWPFTLGVVAAFRFFDILKPWPARQSQHLPGGWGITIDDVLAAGYVNAVVLVLYAGRMLVGR
ncbi:MAG TPA: phosphatidylglycerophosphatase A [Candidatus Binatia bacterium]|jgi:phosphatidylglycerophosphatase A|nr:phosphatidylglycerophosphatase A [Candidatus Binatia bacterium]